jgi:RNA polymerase sigma-70 factor (ECF subfamily)
MRLNNDEKAFSEIYARYVTPLFEVAFRKINEKDVAEDIVQITFIKFWNNRATIVIRQSLKAYLYTALRNNVITHYYRHLSKNTISIDKLGDHQLSRADDVEHKMDFLDLNSRYNESLEQLPEKCREVFVLSRDGYSMKEIAELRNISPKTVEVHIGKALKFLRKKIGNSLTGLFFF